VKPNYFRLFIQLLMGVTLVTLALVYAFFCSYVYLEPTLPTVTAMKNNELAVPLRVYTRSGDQIAQIGEERRNPVKYEQIPLMVRQAFIAAEDDRFFEHHGFDWQGVLRMLFVNLVSADFAQGASTITMQTARSAFFTQEQTVRRKLQEIFVTFRLEREFKKEEILALYLNVIFFGQRSYGVAAAAETYFGKQLDQLTLGEAATLARVPQSPSKVNPITNPAGAVERRGYVLRRMRELGFIDAATAEAANKEPMEARAHAPLFAVEAPYVAEMARLELRQRFGPSAESAGYKVYTTIDGSLQGDANRAVRVGLIEYDRRHGWRGATNKVSSAAAKNPQDLETLLDEYGPTRNLRPHWSSRWPRKRSGLHQGPRARNHRMGGNVVGAPASTNSRSDPSRNQPARCWRAAASSMCCTKRRTRPPNSRRCPRPRAPSSPWIRTTARSCRWSVASITSKAAACSTARPWRNASRDRVSSRSCIQQRSLATSRRPR
jgi:penicillin-binding protein 1A